MKNKTTKNTLRQWMSSEVAASKNGRRVPFIEMKSDRQLIEYSGLFFSTKVAKLLSTLSTLHGHIKQMAFLSKLSSIE